MSELTKSLARLEHWFREHSPVTLETLQPGLSCDEIEALTSDLPFPFPEDLTEFYQWRNGTYPHVNFGESFVPFHIIYSLDSLCKAYERELSYNDWHNPMWEQRWLPLFQNEADYIVADIGETRQTPTQLRDFFREDPDRPLGLLFTNLTTMMQTLADGYEAGVCYIRDRERYVVNSKTEELETLIDKLATIDYDQDEADVIYQTYNPGLRCLWFES